MKEIKIDVGGKTLTLKTGEIAKQSQGAVTVQYGDTVVLATVNTSNLPREGADFLPLTVDYRERTYAAGKIPGGVFKREGRPREKEILTSRIVDRTIRPLFPDGYYYDTQVGITLLSSDVENDSDVLAVIGVAAALLQSNAPFNTPVAAVRVGRLNGEFIINPTYTQRETSDIDIIISATEKGIVMMEGGPDEIDEPAIISAINFGLKHIPELLKCQKEFINKNKPAFEIPKIDETIKSDITKNYKDKIEASVRIHEKKEREQKFTEISCDDSFCGFLQKKND